MTGFSSLMTGDVSNSCISTVVTKLSAVFPLHGLEQKVCFTNAVFYSVESMERHGRTEIF